MTSISDFAGDRGKSEMGWRGAAAGAVTSDFGTKCLEEPCDKHKSAGLI